MIQARILSYIFILLGLLLFSPFLTFAQTSCGSLFEIYGADTYEEPITDCANPFGPIMPNPDLVVTFGTSPLVESGEYSFIGTSSPISYTGRLPETNFMMVGLYKIIPEGYVRINEDDNGTYTFTEAGSYTIVVYEGSLQLNHNFFEKILAFFIPSAYAFIESRTMITFTVVDTPVLPSGISNILFLPGMQASRLYKKGLLWTEDQIWPPSANFGQDLNDLAMTKEGLSENVIYTRDVIDSSLGVGSVYGGFLNYLEGLTDAPLPMKEYTSFAYDWRYDVFDIIESGAPYELEMKSLVDEVERLSQNSYTKKVTIVAHSNGGLLAKALLVELEKRNLTETVDRVIFLASPQLGTPKAIGTILHGYDQSDGYGGIVSDAHTARGVIQNMPGAYGLLPSEKYFKYNSGPIVSFENSPLTSGYRSTYGDSIDTFAEYRSFLLGLERGTTRTLEGLESIPAKANDVLLEKAFENHKNKLDTWIAPEGVKVIEIVGTGLPTMKGVEYRALNEGEDCVSISGAPAVCTPRQILKPYAQFTKYGDRTVVQTSAEAYEGVKELFYFDLSKIKSDFPSSKYRHLNITEIPQIQDLITTVMQGTSTVSSVYVSTSTLSFDDAYDIEIIDSPVRMLAKDTFGNQTGVSIVNGEQRIFENIPGSQYFEFGDTKYLIIPKQTEHVTSLFGEADGNYGLTIVSLGSSNTQSILSQFENATVTPRMVATYAKKGSKFSSITTDINGDGKIDTEMSLSGVTIIRDSLKERLMAVLYMLHLPLKYERILILLLEREFQYIHKHRDTHEEKRFHQLLQQLEKFKKQKLISKEQYRTIEQIIKNSFASNHKKHE